MPQTEAQRRASRAAHAKKLEHGFKRQWFFMAPEAAAHLAKAKAAEEGVTAEALLNRAILLLPVKAATPAPAENSAPPASVTRAKKTPAEPKTPVKRSRVAAPSKKAASEPESGVAASVPYAGDVKRPIYQKGTKR